MDHHLPSGLRRVIAGSALLFIFSGSARAESLFPRLTRKDDMNAVRANGRVWTIQDLIDRRELAPGRFDRYHERLGSALSLGLDGLQARRDLNTRRFDFYHPILGYLLTDVDPGVGGIGQPVPSPGFPDGEVLLPPPDPGFPTNPPSPPQPPIVPPTTPPEVLLPPPDSNGEPNPPVIPPPPRPTRNSRRFPRRLRDRDRETPTPRPRTRPRRSSPSRPRCCNWSSACPGWGGRSPGGGTAVFGLL